MWTSSSDPSTISSQVDGQTSASERTARNGNSAVQREPGLEKRASGPAHGDFEARNTRIDKSASSGKRRTSPRIVISDVESENDATSSIRASENGKNRGIKPESLVAANSARVTTEQNDNQTDSDKERPKLSSVLTGSEETSLTTNTYSGNIESVDCETGEQAAQRGATETPHPKAEKDHKSALEIFNGFFAGCDAYERFRDNSTQCLANTLKGKRCRTRIRGHDATQIQKCFEILEDLSEMEGHIAELQKLANLAICRKSHRSEALRRLAALVLLNGEIIDTHELRPNTTLTRRACESTPVKAATTAATVRFHFTRSTRRSPAVQARITVFLPYLPEYLKKLSLVEVIRKQMLRPLSAREKASGFLYCYWDEATFGYCKIGITTGAVDQRLKQWESQCKKPATLLYEREPMRTPHAYRLEALVHAELKAYRYKEQRCLTCYKTHREWFRIPDSHTIPTAIAIWREWMLKEPYDLVDGRWLLKAAHACDVDTMCQRLLEPPKVISPRQAPVRSLRRPRESRRSSGGRGRYSLRSSTRQASLKQESSPPTQNFLSRTQESASSPSDSPSPPQDSPSDSPSPPPESKSIRQVSSSATQESLFPYTETPIS